MDGGTGRLRSINSGVVAGGDEFNTQFISVLQEGTPPYIRIAPDTRIGCPAAEVFSGEIVHHLFPEFFPEVHSVVGNVSRFADEFSVVYRFQGAAVGVVDEITLPVPTVPQFHGYTHGIVTLFHQ